MDHAAQECAGRQHHGPRAIFERKMPTEVRRQGMRRWMARLELGELRRVPGCGQPAPHPFQFHGDRERLVERGVVLYVRHLVRKLVEDQPRQFGFRIMQEGVQHRVGKPAKRRVGGHAVDDDVVAHRALRPGVPLGAQTVLLKGVNDDPEVMKRLVHQLLLARVALV